MCHMAIYYRNNQISLFVCTFDLPFFIFNLRPLTEFLILLFCIIFRHSWYASWSFLISSRTKKWILSINIVVLSCTVQILPLWWLTGALLHDCAWSVAGCSVAQLNMGVDFTTAFSITTYLGLHAFPWISATALILRNSRIDCPFSVQTQLISNNHISVQWIYQNKKMHIFYLLPSFHSLQTHLLIIMEPTSPLVQES